MRPQHSKAEDMRQANLTSFAMARFIRAIHTAAAQLRASSWITQTSRVMTKVRFRAVYGAFGNNPCSTSTGGWRWCVACSKP
jgi:hypothetical protein